MARPKTAGGPCSRPGCEKPSRAKGLCQTHYSKQWRANAPECTVEGCDRQVWARGFCQTHANRDKFSAKPLDAPIQTRGDWIDGRPAFLTMTGPDDPRHGTSGGYTNQGCREECCKAAWAEYNQGARERRAARLLENPTLAEHGSASTARNWLCRCPLCTTAVRTGRRFRDVLAAALEREAKLTPVEQVVYDISLSECMRRDTAR